MEKVKVYFKGGKGIKNPVDCNGNPIIEGDILTHCWFDTDLENLEKLHKELFKEYSKEEFEKAINEPSVKVKWNPKGFYFGEGIKELSFGSRMYMHDFRFKYSKKVNQ